MANQPLNYRQGGYIALISAIIISFILTGLVYAAARASFDARFDSLNAEYKHISEGLTESCINAALLKLAQNPNYAPNAPENISLGTDEFGNTKQCAIENIIFNPHEGYDSNHQKVATIQASAHYPDKTVLIAKLMLNQLFMIRDTRRRQELLLMALMAPQNLKSNHNLAVLPAIILILVKNKIFLPVLIKFFRQFDDSDYQISISGDCNCNDNTNCAPNSITISITATANTYALCNIIYTQNNHNQ